MQLQFATAHRMVFVAIVLALIGCKPERAARQHSPTIFARQQLSEMLAAGVGEELIIEHALLVDDDLELLEKAPQLQRVEIRDNKLPLGDAAFAHLAKLPNLEWINVSARELTDEGVALAAKLPKLRILNLHATRISDAGLQSLAPLEHLELLRFGSPHATDAGMEHIAAIKSLRFLHLIDVPITDDGLKTIAGMPQLESFYLDGGNTTDEGLSALVKARPDLHFHQDQQHLYDDPWRSDHGHGEGHAHSHDE